MWAGTVFDTENFALIGSLQILRTKNKILDTVHIKETSCKLNLLTVHTCRYFSKSQFKLAGTYQNSDRGVRVVW